MKRRVSVKTDVQNDIEKINCTTYGIYIKKYKYQKMFDTMRCKMVDYKNGFIKCIWKELYAYAEKDEEFKNALQIIKTQNKVYGNAVFTQDLDEKVVEAYKYFSKIVFSKEKAIDLNKLMQQYMKSASKIYKIYLPDDMRNNGLKDVISGFDAMASMKAKFVWCKKYDDLSALISKPMFPKSRETGDVNYNKRQRFNQG